MRRHANAQNVVPNNQRQIPASPEIQTSNNNVVGSTEISSGNRLQATKSTKLKDQRDAKQKRNEWRITRMIFAIFLSFIFCYLPITITKVLDKDVNWPVLHIIGYVMIYLRFVDFFSREFCCINCFYSSACINPIIYVIMNKQYRQAYKTVLLCKATRLLSFAHVGSSHGGKFRFLNGNSFFGFNCNRNLGLNYFLTNKMKTNLSF